MSKINNAAEFFLEMRKTIKIPSREWVVRINKEYKIEILNTKTNDLLEIKEWNFIKGDK